MARKINEIQDTVPLQKSGGTGLDIFSAGLADGEGRIVDSGGSPVWNWDADGSIHAKGLPRVVYSNATPVQNSVTAAQDLMVFTIPAGLMANDGDVLRINSLSFGIAAQASIAVYLDNMDMIVADYPGWGSGSYVRDEIILVRTGATSVLGTWNFSATQTDLTFGLYDYQAPLSDISPDWSTDIPFKFRVESASGLNRFRQDFMQVVYEPAPV